MAGIFISHSSKNNTQAENVRSWLESQGWGRSQVFLDLRDLKSGDRWRDVLNGMSDCEAVIVCLSDEWLSSDECKREFTQAEERGKVLLPIAVAPITLPIPRFITDLQIGDSSAEGIAKLRDQLFAKRITPESFPWPPANEPHRAVYRGLEALDVKDAAIFFGRDADILRALDELRSLRNSRQPAILAVLGPSGAGKSSFMRAGVIARLQRDDANFLVLPIIRPENSAISGAHGLFASLSSALGSAVSPNTGAALAKVLDDIRKPVLARLERNAMAANEAQTHYRPTVIIPIDQAEELFGVDNSERGHFLKLITDAAEIDGDVLIIATIRSDSYELLQNGWMPDRQVTFSLPSIAAGLFQEVIEGPARLATPPLSVEPALTQQLLVDLDAADALPLLAFTLEQLQTDYGRDGKLTLIDYSQKLGGLPGAIQSAANAVLGKQPSTDDLAMARRLFVPALVTVSQDRVHRRVARRTELPTEAGDLCDRFVARRLLVTDGENVEVAHEAILRQWPALSMWIAEERSALEVLESVRLSAREWSENKSEARHEDWLAHQGDRLATALALAERGEFSLTLSGIERSYLEVCREEEALRKQEEAFERLRRTLLLKFTDTYLESEERNYKRLGSKLYLGMWSRDGLEFVQTLRGSSRRWHPSPAQFVESLGIDHHFGDKDRYRFSCCDLEVVAGDEPSQFRADGCATAPERKGAPDAFQKVAVCPVAPSLRDLMNVELPHFGNEVFRRPWSTRTEALQVVYFKPEIDDVIVRRLEESGMSRRAIHLDELLGLSVVDSAVVEPEPKLRGRSNAWPAMVAGTLIGALLVGSAVAAYLWTFGISLSK